MPSKKSKSKKKALRASTVETDDTESQAEILDPDTLEAAMNHIDEYVQWLKSFYMEKVEKMDKAENAFMERLGAVRKAVMPVSSYLDGRRKRPPPTGEALVVQNDFLSIMKLLDNIEAVVNKMDDDNEYRTVRKQAAVLASLDHTNDPEAIWQKRYVAPQPRSEEEMTANRHRSNTLPVANIPAPSQPYSLHDEFQDLLVQLCEARLAPKAGWTAPPAPSRRYRPVSPSTSDSAIDTVEVLPQRLILEHLGTSPIYHRLTPSSVLNHRNPAIASDQTAQTSDSRRDTTFRDTQRHA
jgi:hypothetical protein